MARISKKRKTALSKFDQEKTYSVADASKLVKDITTTKFDASVDLAVRLGVDPRKANQMVRGTVSLPHGTGKSVRVLALVPAEKEAEAKAAGADYVGLDEYIEKIKGGWTDIDVIITVPQGLMPNPKTGTVTMEIGKAVTESKGGKIDFKVDKAGIIHASVGKASFDAAKIEENANELLNTIVKLKPSSAKGSYVRSVCMSSTMSPGIAIDTKNFN